jgi:hypothetical protein
MNEAIKALFEEQVRNWEMAKKNYAALAHVRVKTFEVNGYEYHVQFNPVRIISSSAKIDEQSIRERKCFLCRNHLPAEQKSIIFNGRYSILVNPYPVFPRHLTIPELSHTPQHILFHIEDMLDLAQKLDDFIIFYNGPECGASAPDHFHFQAGNKGFLPIEKDRKLRCPLVRISENKTQVIDWVLQIYHALERKSGDGEPMLNILAWYDRKQWIVCIFPRKRHRPACYSAEGEQNCLISLAAVEMGGVWVTPLEKDFCRFTATDIEAILQEVCIQDDQLQKLQNLNK